MKGEFVMKKLLALVAVLAMALAIWQRLLRMRQLRRTKRLVNI